MRPLRISLNNTKIYESENEKDFLVPVGKTGYKVLWTGDENGKSYIFRDGERDCASFNLGKAGDKGECYISITIAPIEFGESTDTVKWKVGVERV